MMNSHRHVTLLILGAVVAILMMVTQVGYYHIRYSVIDSIKIVTEEETQGKENKIPDFTTISHDAISTIFALNVQQEFHFIYEICLESANKAEVALIKLVRPSKYFLTLFRRIISPNAP
ncbi:MAG: hypothetical protein OEY51_12585 [Cyclobacteriaceae bacterium]|nr:hypothetical protein [Cyclobacteriaceae bacterium]